MTLIFKNCFDFASGSGIKLTRYRNQLAVGVDDDYLVTLLSTSIAPGVYEQLVNKGAVNGYAPLDANTKVPTANLGGAGADNTKFLRGDQTWQAPATPPPPPDIGEGHITILPWHYSSITQGTWATYITGGNQVFNAIFYNSSNAQNDQIDFKAYLAAGTYTFSLITFTNTNLAILTLLINGVSQGTIDLYGGSTVWNVIKTITGIVIASSGLKTISLKAASKNGSSSGYQLNISSMAMFRTA